MPLFGNDFSAAWHWLNTPASALNNSRPIDLVTAAHIETVRDHLIRLEYGVYT
ncbi:antitoxin Xre/MbcA/ParS toxin-binding domain-containing protein [Massilia phyllostachyos]|uniref:antitoxin Xre/MbcA/ParS toxin-binding domain-containing protein n=1 Tax=Massilia phyllostachyos TaxID=2898585 RepID=UPI0035306000